jgi:hypothetical protein
VDDLLSKIGTTASPTRFSFLFLLIIYYFSHWTLELTLSGLPWR